MADDPKTFLALLNGIAKRTYYGESDITDELLKSELYDAISPEEFNLLLNRATGIIKSMVSADMDFNQSEAFLTSQMKKREGSITEDQANALRKFWKTHKNKIHEAVVSRTTWNNTLKHISWRIDIKSQARHIDQINTPTAIMELQIGANDKTIQVTRTAIKAWMGLKFSKIEHGSMDSAALECLKKSPWTKNGSKVVSTLMLSFLDGSSSFLQKSDVVRFEMDEEKLASLLQNMKEIENEVNKYCQQ